MSSKLVLLTGATGFVGRAVRPALVAAGWRVRCLSRDVARASAEAPGLDWVEGDVRDERTSGLALEGCQAALYLVHGIGEDDVFVRRERAAARRFARTAHAAGLRRLVYLGGVAPKGDPSPHLRSRLLVGEELRAGAVPAIELRASMIVGHGSLSWLVVRDLAARLPVMVLPSWLRSRTQPVAIDDVVAALVGALDMPFIGSASFDLPGPDALSGRQILEVTAEMLGHARPRIVEVPVLTPRLSAQWVRLVTRARWQVAREIVIGLVDDLLARDDRFWQLVGREQLLGFREAAARALAAERAAAPVRGPWGTVERLLQAR